MFSRIFFTTLFAFLILTGCKKDDIEFPVTPSISYEGSSTLSANQYGDPLILFIKYEDGDGDLGENKDGIKNCFVTDNRINITYEYRIKQLAPLDAKIPITGLLHLDLGTQVITDSSAVQNVTYTIYVVDREGHASNPVTTPSIAIHR